MRGKCISYIMSILNKVITNTELAEHWTIAPKGNTVLGSCKILVPFPSTDQYINLFCMCLCLKKPYWIATVDSSTLNSGPAELWFMPEPSLSNTRIFPASDIPAFLNFGTLGSASAAYLGAVLNAESPTKSTKIRKTWHKMDQEKDTCLQNKSWNKKAECDLVPRQLWMCMSGDSNFFTTAHAQEWPPQVLIWGLQINFLKEAISQIQNLWNEGLLYFALVIVFSKWNLEEFRVWITLSYTKWLEDSVPRGTI